MGKKEDEAALVNLSAGEVPSIADTLAPKPPAGEVPSIADTLGPVAAASGPVTLPQKAYGDTKLPHLKTFVVSFVGKGSEKYPQPVRVVAIDGSDAWSQVVAHYGLDGSGLDCTRFHPDVRVEGPAVAA